MDHQPTTQTLIVSAGNSGAQIALDLAEAGRQLDQHQPVPLIDVGSIKPC